MALVLKNQKKVDMLLNKEIKKETFKCFTALLSFATYK